MILLRLKDIDPSKDTQPRSTIDQALIDEYAEAMREGAEFPAVHVTHDGSTYWLTDGFHRVAAAGKAGRDTITAIVTEGSHEDAVWTSLAANATHGKRRTRTDLQRAIKRVLTHEGWRKRSDREIARHLGCSPSTVGIRRKELESDPTVQFGQSDERVGADGRTINTSNIGAKPSKEEVIAAPTPVPTPEAAPQQKAAPVKDDGVPLSTIWQGRFRKVPDLPVTAQDEHEWEGLVLEWKRRFEQLEAVLDSERQKLRQASYAADISAPASQIWKMLGVPPGDDRAAKRVVRKLQRLSHPDHGGDAEAFAVAQNLSREAGL